MPITVQRILAATDFSPAGQRAVNEAAHWARQMHAHLRIVHVTPPNRWLPGLWGAEAANIRAIQQHAANALKKVADQADPQKTLELSTGVLSGGAASSIARAARDFEADLIVVGARGERDAGRERGLAGTSSKLLAGAPAPLLLVRRTHPGAADGVVAAVDLSQRSRTVLEWAVAAAATNRLYVCHVYDMPFAPRLESYGLTRGAIDVYSQQAQARHEAELAAIVGTIERGGETTYVVERGDPGILLARYVEAVRPSLIVLGKHVKTARSSPTGSVGSVCRYIANSVMVDVLVV
jgi:nucleotide-binding universal stress UspA family protein